MLSAPFFTAHCPLPTANFSATSRGGWGFRPAGTRMQATVWPGEFRAVWINLRAFAIAAGSVCEAAARGGLIASARRPSDNAVALARGSGIGSPKARLRVDEAAALQFFRAGYFDDAPQVHHRHARRNVLDDRQPVRDEEIVSRIRLQVLKRLTTCA